jgi:putative ABC transport system permease protein
MLADFRYALRMLTNTPGFTAVAVLTLALGLGVNTIVFSAVNALWLRPLPVDQPQTVVCGYAMRDGIDPYETSLLEYSAYRGRSHSFASTGLGDQRVFHLLGRGEPQRLRGAAVTADYFSTLGVKTFLGRLFQPGEYRASGPAVAVISYRFWQRLYGGEAAIVGQALRLEQGAYTIVGVLPPGFDMPFAADVWLPLQTDKGGLSLEERARTKYDFIARLKPGVNLKQADAELKSIARALELDYPQFRRGWSYKLISLRQNLIGDLEGRTRKAVLALVAGVGLVLFICCANLANLLLARGVAREREFGIRFALGATRSQVARQLLTESLLLALLGGLVGLASAYWIAPVLGALSPVQAVSMADLVRDFRIDGRVVGFTFVLALLAAATFGLIPALKVVQSRDLITVIKQREQRAGGTSGGRRLLDSFVVAEIALAATLLVSGALIVQSFRSLQRINLGFHPDNLLMIEMALSSSKYHNHPQRVAFANQVLARVKTLPGVRSASTTTTYPLELFDSASSFTVEGRPPPPPESAPMTIHRVVSPEYFETIGITLLKGRSLSEKDTAQSLPVVVVNRELARQAWPSEDPLGKRIRRGGPNETDFPWLTVVGVVGNVKEDRFNFRSDRPAWYLPYAQQESTNPLHLMVRTAVPPANLVGPIRSTIKSVDPGQPIANISTMSEHLQEALIKEKFSAVLMGTLAAIGLVLAVVGLYGVMAYSVGQRTGEIGLRMALGAQARDIFGLVVRHGLTLIAAGLTIGLCGAYLVTRGLSATLYQISPADPFTFVCVGVLLTSVALLACYIPARHAMKLDPTVALRQE